MKFYLVGLIGYVFDSAGCVGLLCWIGMLEVMWRRPLCGGLSAVALALCGSLGAVALRFASLLVRGSSRVGSFWLF